MSEELERAAELIERLLGDPELRRRFRTDAAGVLVEAGLPEMAAGLGRGRRAMMTLELRESRSSLAGAMVAAAAEGVDLAQAAAHAAPALAHDVSEAVARLDRHPKPKPAPHAAVAKPAPQTPSFAAPAQQPALAAPQPAAQAAVPDQSVPVTEPAASASAPAAPAADPTSAGAGSHAASATQPAQPAQLATTTPADQSAAAASTAAGAGAGAQGTVDAAAGAGAPSGAGSAADHPAGAAAVHPGHHHHPHAASSDGAATTAAEPADAGGYPGDQASPQQIAAWMGERARQAGLPPELPVMAALTESGLRNLTYGDRDSVGFFQMRLGIWNEGPYAGYPDHPELQIQWFIDHALAVRAQDPGLAQSPGSWGEWVANVEQPAAEYRYRYQLQLEQAQELLRGANFNAVPASGGTADAASAVSAPVHAPPPPPPVPVGQAALNVALHLGANHGGGGFSQTLGSSELVQYAYARQDIHIPSVPTQQFEVGMPVGRHALKPGDAVFFAEPNGYIHQVGLYVGHNEFITTTGHGGAVRTESLEDSKFAAEYVGARRYTASALTNPSNYARPLPTIKR